MNRTPLEKVGDFLLGRGFYIVLFLCVATIGFSGYYLVQSFTPSTSSDVITPTNAAPEIILPDPVTTQTATPTPTVEEDPIQVETVETEEIAVVEPVEITIPTEAVASTPLVFTWPVKGVILRAHSLDTLVVDETMEDWRTHDGLDISAALGTEVLSPSSGTVLSVLDDDLMGTTVVIDHGNGLVSTLANLSPVAVVEAGDTVTTGTVIGAVGETAISESGMDSHLHLSMALDGQPVNPVDYLPK